jgi:L-ribulose-5-phosphate 3-epimerase
MNTLKHNSVSPRLAVCSWSLEPRSPRDLADALRQLDISAVQLALEPLRDGSWSEIETLSALRAAGVTIISGMYQPAGEDYSSLGSIKLTGGLRPSATWLDNQARAVHVARIASRLGLPLVTFHAGFIPHDPADPERQVMIDRLQEVVDIFDDHNIRVGFETGQETALTLQSALDELERPHAGINFDPANMILYGMGDPISALSALAPRVVQIHIKDAIPAATPGQWGTEVPVGAGGVDWSSFFGLIRQRNLGVDLVIEREAGTQRRADISAAAELIRRFTA